MRPMKLSHFGEQAQIIIGGERIGSETDVEFPFSHCCEFERRMAEVFVTAGAVDDVRFSWGILQLIEIAVQNRIQMNQQPSIMQRSGRVEHLFHWRDIARFEQIHP